MQGNLVHLVISHNGSSVGMSAEGAVDATPVIDLTATVCRSGHRAAREIARGARERDPSATVDVTTAYIDKIDSRVAELASELAYHCRSLAGNDATVRASIVEA